MKSIEYVKTIINNLVEVFPSIKCSYEVDKFDNSHTIEILPSIFFDRDNDFKKAESNIYEDFFRLYPYEVLYFITNTSVLPIQNPIYVKKGVEYASISKITTSNTNEAFNISSEKLNIYSDYNLKINSFDVRENIFQNNNINILQNYSPELAGEGNYALAA